VCARVFACNGKRLRQGVGSLLIDTAVDHAERFGVPRLYLWAKVEHRGIYARRGFRDLER
jgi:N-acetylglutamate synthase-like GNAT family acetyltransferase